MPKEPKEKKERKAKSAKKTVREKKVKKPSRKDRKAAEDVPAVAEESTREAPVVVEEAAAADAVAPAKSSKKEKKQPKVEPEATASDEKTASADAFADAKEQIEEPKEKNEEKEGATVQVQEPDKSEDAETAAKSAPVTEKSKEEVSVKAGNPAADKEEKKKPSKKIVSEVQEKADKSSLHNNDLPEAIRIYLESLESRLGERISLIEQRLDAIESGSPRTSSTAEAAGAGDDDTVGDSDAEAGNAAPAPIAETLEAVGSQSEGVARSSDGHEDDPAELPTPTDPGQSMPGWMDALSDDSRKLIMSHGLEEKTFWKFITPGDEQFDPDAVTALADALRALPKGRLVTRVDFNMSCDDIRLRHGKDLGGALAEAATLKEVVVRSMRRQGGWTMLVTATDLGLKSLQSIVLQDLTFPESWSGAQATKVLSSGQLMKFVLQGGVAEARGGLSRQDVNLIYDSIVGGLTQTTSVEEVQLRNLPNWDQGDVSRFLDKLQRNSSIKKLYLCGEGLFDRLKTKSLAEYILKSKQLEEVHVQGVDGTFFETGDLIVALEKSPHLKIFDATPVENATGGKAKGMRIDDFKKAKLQKIVDSNPGLRIFTWDESDKPICIHA